jgi:hypothetical protein
MKFWRRHKHELNRTEEDEPLPQPPEKKMRYSRGDDILLAKYFFNKPEGTSDKIFQAFGRAVSLHCLALCWDGWPIFVTASPSSLEGVAGTSSHTQS